MARPQLAAALGESREGVLRDLFDVIGVGFLVEDVQVIAADEPDAQHRVRHDQQRYGLLPVKGPDGSGRPVGWLRPPRDSAPLGATLAR